MFENNVTLRCARLLCLSMAFAAHAGGADADREKYTPYPGDGYPQIIQRHDYPTIQCIEALYERLEPLGPPSRGGLGATLLCEASPEVLTFRSVQDPKKKLRVKVAGDEAVMFGDKRFTNPATVIFFKTMLRVVRDLAQGREPFEVSITRFGARAYKKRTIIAFDFQTRIVEIICNSNGPRDPERLYILDLVGRDESFFWSH